MIKTVIRNIPFAPPDISQDEIEEVVRVMKSGWITTDQERRNLKRDS